MLTPTAEHAALLYDAIERAHREAGDLVWSTPRIREFGSWLREQHARRQLVFASGAEGVNGIATLRGLNDIEERELWREVVRESPQADAFLEPSGAALAARRARAVMSAYAIPLTALADQASDEALALADWIRRFDRRCRDLGCVANEALLGSFQRTPEPCTWIESPSWQPVARRWLQTHAGAALVHATRREAPASIRVLEADGAAAEIAALAEWAARGLRSASPMRAWICVPDLLSRRDELIDAFDAALAPQRYALADSGGRPAYASMRACARRSSCWRSRPASCRSSASVPACVRPSIRGPCSRPAVQPRSMCCCGAGRRASRACRRGSRSRSGSRASNPLSRWVPTWVAAFEAGPWCHRARWASGEYQAADRLRELLSTLASGDGLYGRRSRPSAERLLAAAARDTSFQAQTGIPPIWVSGALVDPWLDFDALWITGLSADRWPPPAEPVPLLPIALQRQFGVLAASAR